MLTREDFERIEEKVLAPYAVHSRKSMGRKYPETPPLHRTQFQRDRDRIVHSKAFRRLMHKTQVFVAFEGDHYRTRLTHTMEVAQIARHISRLLSLNEDLTEAIALAHDLGHTPFGHAGEEALSELRKEQGGFEHNRQSRRIVEWIERKYKDFPGLNLTYEVRDGLIKHRSAHDHPEQAESNYPSLESRVVNMADEIAYNSHDLDDGLSAGIIKLKDLEEVLLWREASEHNRSQFTNLDEEELKNLNVRFLIGQQIMDLASQADVNIKREKFIEVKQVYQCPKKILKFSLNMKEKNKELRAFLMKKFYKHPEILKMNKEAQGIIESLYDYYLDNLAEVPFIDRLEDYPSELAVTDYIAGMTDNFAQAEYKRCVEGV
ncbi:deoxyguanosinetriphosphate triphosphohydrolase [Candidatus Margulisiibacteriota bacterium]